MLHFFWVLFLIGQTSLFLLNPVATGTSLMVSFLLAAIVMNFSRASLSFSAVAAFLLLIYQNALDFLAFMPPQSWFALSQSVLPLRDIVLFFAGNLAVMFIFDGLRDHPYKPFERHWKLALFILALALNFILIKLSQFHSFSIAVFFLALIILGCSYRWSERFKKFFPGIAMSIFLLLLLLGNVLFATLFLMCFFCWFLWSSASRDYFRLFYFFFLASALFVRAGTLLNARRFFLLQNHFDPWLMNGAIVVTTVLGSVCFLQAIQGDFQTQFWVRHEKSIRWTGTFFLFPWLSWLVLMQGGYLIWPF